MLRKIYFPLSLFLLLISILVSCSKRVHQTTAYEPVLFPAPPDTARIQFLSRYGNSSDITGKPSKFKSFVAGEEEPLPIVKPYGIEIENGKIYIADPGIAGLQVIDLEKKAFKYFNPGGRGALKLPVNCFVDSAGILYVTDVGRRQVVIFNESLSYAGEIGGDTTFRPIDIFVTGKSILVTDPDNNRVNIYDRQSQKLLFRFPENAVVGDDHWLYNPMNIWVRKDKIYITDFGDSRIKIFSMNGEYLNSVGSYGRGLGQFVRPKGVAVDNDENLYVVDAGFQNVQVFNKEGQLLMFFGGPYKGPGDMYLPANITIDYKHLSHFKKFVDPAFELKFLIFVTNQYGPDKVSVYGRVELK